MLLRKPFLCQGLGDHAESNLQNGKVRSYPDPDHIRNFPPEFTNSFTDDYLKYLSVNTAAAKDGCEIFAIQIKHITH